MTHSQSNRTKIAHYSIGTLAKLSGFSESLLRMWERRYGLLRPARAGNGYRRYQEEDLQLLLRIRALVDEGHKIGEVAELGRTGLLSTSASIPTVDLASPIAEVRAQLPLTNAEQVLDALPCAVVLTDAFGRTEWVNAGFVELCSYDTTDLAGKTPGSVLQGPLTDKDAVDRMRLAIRARRACSELIANYDKRGRMYWALVDVAPITHGGGDGFIGVARDLTRTLSKNPTTKE